ncbi:MAG: sortase [Ruminococcus sp.]|nr:sortase [Ruminococcus sp.]
MTNKLGKCFILVGAVLLIAALSLVLFNKYQSDSAYDKAQSILSELQEKMPSETIDSTDSKALEQIELEQGYVPTIEVDGNEYLGVIYIPSIDTELPVIKDWSNDNLDIAPCRYYGSVAENNLIIAAHNYATYFDKVENLVPGDIVIFVTADGIKYEYEVSTTELIGGGNPARMKSDFDSWDLTLFTCTWSGRSRVTIRCVLRG